MNFRSMFFYFSFIHIFLMSREFQFLFREKRDPDHALDR